MEMILGLEQLQAQNVVHRDLKPQNILLDDTYHLKLTDFGAAKQINPEDVEAEINLKNFD
jgi:serine/threonine protein kinase